MSSLPSIPKRAIISIQPDPMSPFEFMNVNDAKEMLNSRHVGGIKRRRTLRNRKTKTNRRRKAGGSAMVLINTCGPGSCGGSRGSRRNKKKNQKN